MKLKLNIISVKKKKKILDVYVINNEIKRSLRVHTKNYP